MTTQTLELQAVTDEELLGAAGGFAFLLPMIGAAVGIGKGQEEVVREANTQDAHWGQGWSRG